MEARGHRSGAPELDGGMAKNIVICLDGTNNKLRAAVNTNVVRLFEMLYLSDPSTQVGYYDPGVGTFSSAAAWTPPARTISRYAGLMFGAGLRQNLGEAYSFLMSVWEPGDRIFIFGFSRGAYTARALTGMLEVFGIFRRGCENLVPYAISEYAKQDSGGPRDWAVLNEYAKVFGRDLHLDSQHGHRDHAPIHFLGRLGHRQSRRSHRPAVALALHKAPAARLHGEARRGHRRSPPPLRQLPGLPPEPRLQASDPNRSGSA